MELGKTCQAVVMKLEKERRDRELPQRKLQELREEKDQLEQSRKQLDENKQEQLRQLELEQRLHLLQPSYMQADEATLDNLNYEIATELVEVDPFLN